MRPRCEFAASTAARGFCTTDCSAQPTRIQPTARTIVRLRLFDICNTAASNSIEVSPGKYLFPVRVYPAPRSTPHFASRLRASLTGRLPGKLSRAMRTTPCLYRNRHRASRTFLGDRLFRSNDHANGQIDRISFDREFPELLPNFFHITMLTSFFGITTILRICLPAMSS